VTVINLLLAAGANASIVDNDGVTCLMSAASQGHTEAVRLFLDLGLGIQVDAVANSGGTSLMFAAGAGHNDTTQLLIERGADVNRVVQATPGYIEQVRVDLTGEGVWPL
jgi:ankyrin repeat protein